MDVFRISLLHLGLLATAAAAQGRVWIVDAQNGPGTHFTDLPPAVVAAADGDLIQMRAGLYRGTVISKGLTVIGASGAAIDPMSTTALTVQNLPAGRQVVLAGLTVTPTLAYGATLVLSNNQGRILLDRISAATAVGGGTLNALVAISDCAHVQINQCSILRSDTPLALSPALNASRSTVVVCDSRLRGGNTMTGPFAIYTGSAALRAEQSNVTISRGTLEGGNGADAVADRPAITSYFSTLVVGGDATTVLRAGQQQIGATPAIETDRGSVTCDPNVTLVSNRPAVPPISGTAPVVRTWVPSLAAHGAGPGGTVQTDLFAPAGDVALVLTGLVADPLELPPIGRLWLNPNLFIVAGVGVVGASGHLSHSFPIASDPNLSFGAWSVQALSGTFAGGFRLSNPAAYVLAN